MEPPNDQELLAQYASQHSETAFSELVARHVALVHSAAMRQVREPQLAEDVTQTVFILLARKAKAMSRHEHLSGWLCRTAYFVSRDALRVERRRLRREQTPLPMENPAETDWKQVAPLLDEVVAQLNEKDRSAIVLRFYQQKSLDQVGTVLGVDADAAQKRVSRALEKLRKNFFKRGVSSSTAMIAGAISANSIQAAPVTLAKTVTAAAMAKGVAASGSTLTLTKGALKIMAWTKIKTAIVVGIGVIFAAGITTVGVKSIHPGEPSYGGKTLTAWLEASKNLVFVDASDTQADQRKKHAELQMTYEAVQHIGPRAIPILLKWLANTTNGGGYILAASCIQKIGPEAKAAVPGLIAILGSDNEMERYSSFNVLQRIGSAADLALPAILDHIQHDPSDGLRSFGVTTLANSGIGKSNPKVVVPILIECLASTNQPINRGETLRALAGLGASAKPAVPAILPYLKDPNLELRTAAQNALSQIDPTAAATMQF